ncbi:hypothetical protein EJ05DRAFT_642 [Pseudovirgaria hyperparasitica]|uniref:DUF3669 domain-containing protein n=1 Tax=Pseudovirgaria hyperparasitica TaxID=470096 RepID=A0A6A6WJL9_9PEZI|nr:uncharacterized protein EJ05DRAFT_642 [Pseudovirgaria hyperparasitica]KAF2762410.1 hypothetical protein EJ05DRAFT_642 [Pseudovirgaria hyperparasitica]
MAIPAAPLPCISCIHPCHCTDPPYLSRTPNSPRSLKPRDPPFIAIGAGASSIVYARRNRHNPHLSSSSPARCVLKRSLNTLESDLAIWNEYVMHARVLQSLAECKPTLAPTISVPACHDLVLAGPRFDNWWATREARFPSSEKERGCIAISERIRGFGGKEIDAVDDKLWLDGLCRQAIQGEEEESVLLRVYLGRTKRLSGGTSPGKSELGDYALCVDQMEALELPMEEYARSMAEVLAIMYFDVGMDAAGIEFVIAPPRAKPRERNVGKFQEMGLGGPDSPWISEALGTHTLWLLDFDEVKNVVWGREGLERAAIAFLDNNPYFPRPGQKHKSDRMLWKVFKSRFLEASKMIIGRKSVDEADKLMDMPGAFMNKLEQIVDEKNRASIRLVYSFENIKVGDNPKCAIQDFAFVLSRT